MLDEMLLNLKNKNMATGSFTVETWFRLDVIIRPSNCGTATWKQPQIS